MNEAQQAEFERRYPGLHLEREDIRGKNGDYEDEKTQAYANVWSDACEWMAQQQAAALAAAEKFEPIACFDILSDNPRNAYSSEQLAAARQQGIEEGKRLGREESLSALEVLRQALIQKEESCIKLFAESEKLREEIGRLQVAEIRRRLP